MRDKGPQKRYVRDYVDARLSLGEVLLPLLVLVILSYFFDRRDRAVRADRRLGRSSLVVVVEGVVVGIILRRKLADKFGADRSSAGCAGTRSCA